MKPQVNDAVLGGNQIPPPGTAVLGTGKLYGAYFTRFNNEAKPCNRLYLRLQLNPKLSLTRRRNVYPLEDITVKVLVEVKVADEIEVEELSEDWFYKEEAWYFSRWEFAGYLKHDGPLFGNTAKYDPANSELDVQEIVVKMLRG